MRRTALWRRKMDALGCAGRIQSLVPYDCNRTNIQQWIEAANASGAIDTCAMPNYLPFSEGFLRQPNFFIDHYGPIERDLERIIDEMDQKSAEAGVRPQLIIEWIGFGGHARISYLFHEMLTERFHGARILPVYCIPDDRVLEQNIRDYNLWHEAQDIIGNGPAIITDNRTTTNLQTLDERIAIIMAAAEACYKFRPEYGTMAETASTFALHGSRWLGLQISNVPYIENLARNHRIADTSKTARLSTTEAREAQAAVTARAQAIKDAIWRIAKPANDEHYTGFLGDTEHDAEQRIYCLLPFHPEITDLIKEDVEDQLQREHFSGPFPGTKVCFAAGNANYSNRPVGYTYGHICKVFGLSAETTPPSVARVLDPDNNYRGRRRRVLSRGEVLMQELNIPLNSMVSQPNTKQMTLTPHTDDAAAAKNGDLHEPEVPPDIGTGAAPLLTSAHTEERRP